MEEIAITMFSSAPGALSVESQAYLPYYTTSASFETNLITLSFAITFTWPEEVPL